ncbi:MAG: hypothetical protein ABFC34_11250 [Methanobacterium sp.]
MEGPDTDKVNCIPPWLLHYPVTEGGALETIIKQPNIIYENNPREALSVLGREYDRIYEEIVLLQPGTREYEKLKKQGQENIQAREKIIGKILLKHDHLGVQE